MRQELSQTERRFAAHLQHASVAYAAGAFKQRDRSSSNADSISSGGNAFEQSPQHQHVMLSSQKRASSFDGSVSVNESGKYVKRPLARPSRVKPEDSQVKPEDSQLLLDFFVSVQSEESSAVSPDSERRNLDEKRRSEGPLEESHKRPRPRKQQPPS